MLGTGVPFAGSRYAWSQSRMEIRRGGGAFWVVGGRFGPSGAARACLNADVNLRQVPPFLFSGCSRTRLAA